MQYRILQLSPQTAWIALTSPKSQSIVMILGDAPNAAILVSHSVTGYADQPRNHR